MSAYDHYNRTLFFFRPFRLVFYILIILTITVLALSKAWPVTARLAIPVRVRAAKRRKTQVFALDTTQKRLEFQMGLYRSF